MGLIICSLAKLYCQNWCDASVVASALAFHPPNPSLYDMEYNESTSAYTLKTAKDLESNASVFDGILIPTIITTSTGTKVPLVCLVVPNSSYTLIYSHGNATDIGAMYSRYVDLATRLKVTVIGYDDSGIARTLYNRTQTFHSGT